MPRKQPYILHLTGGDGKETTIRCYRGLQVRALGPERAAPAGERGRCLLRYAARAIPEGGLGADIPKEDWIFELIDLLDDQPPRLEVVIGMRRERTSKRRNVVIWHGGGKQLD